MSENRFQNVDLSQYNGYLLKKGNCVYIPTDSPYDYERAGQLEFKRLMEADGTWNVVDKLEQAHFVAIFYTGIKGRRDMSMIYFRTRSEYANNKFIVPRMSNNGTTIKSDVLACFTYDTGETESENVSAARFMVNIGKQIGRIACSAWILHLSECTYNFYREAKPAWFLN